MIFRLNILIFMGFLFYRQVDTYKFESTLGHIKPHVNQATQESAVLNLIKRILPDRYENFTVKVNPDLKIDGKELFKIRATDFGFVYIEGTTGVTVATGFHYYLKYFCNCHISWEVSQLNLPDKLPAANVTLLLNDRFRYYQNVCTTSYSFVWWNWTQWENHIDWMVMNSFNFVLAFNGQELLLKRVYKKLNLTDEEIDKHFSGPAFLSWQRMGNIRGWTGPLSDAWHSRSLTLQKQILTRMRSFGIIPILPAFAGYVPSAFSRLYPDAQMTKMGNWNNFPEPYCCTNFINPTDSLFRTIGKMFIEEQINEYGTDHVYNCDNFNEMEPPNGTATYLANVGRNVYGAMTDADPDAIWLMQGWLFVHSFFFWTPERAEALLTSVPNGKMIILDLQSEQFPQYQRFKQYFGQPYIWCMLHNFGGTLGMYGSAPIINHGVVNARNVENSTMIGTGLSMEGINQNYVIYDLMIESAWRTVPTNLSHWFRQYAKRRYGKDNSYVEEAWQILMNTIYNYQGVEKKPGVYAITKSPSVDIITWTWYNYTDLFDVWNLFIQAAEDLNDSRGYLHDLVDITRQVLQVNGDIYYNKLMLDYRNKDLDDFQETAKIFRGIFDDLELILASNEAFLLGKWLEAAKQAAANNTEAITYEYMARNQITLWGPFGEINNYAIKQWSGITKDFLYPRWNVFIDFLNTSLINNSTLNKKLIKSVIFWQHEEPFCFSNSIYPVLPTGDTIQIAKDIQKKPWYTNLGVNWFDSLEN